MLEKLADLSKHNEISEADKDAFYCEMQYERDRSSFAGMAFKIFFSERREYGLEILFLVYSDLRSSQKIFEELINKVEQNVDIIKTILDSETS